MDGIILDLTYEVNGTQAIVHLYGKLNNGETFLARIPRKALFYIRKSDVKKAKKLIADLNTADCTLKTMYDEPVCEVLVNIPREVPEIRDFLHDNNIPTFEADIRFAYRYLIDNNITTAISIEGDYSKTERINRVYDNPVITKGSWNGRLVTLSIDIETDDKASSIWSISMTTGSRDEKIIIGRKVAGAHACDDEKQALVLLNNLIRDIDPDIITGWNFIDFDMKVLQKKYREHSVKMDWARSEKETSIRLQSSYFRDSKADVTGRQVLDGISLLRWNFIKLDSYTLENVSQEILGRGKLFKGKARHEDIKKAYDNNPELLLDYNLKDAQLVLDIIDKTNVLSLSVKRSILTGMPLDRIKASIASLDMVYLPRLHSKGFVAPTGGHSRKTERITGGFVMKSKPGIYDNVIVCDFKSLYPSIMRTLAIDPLAYAQASLHEDDKLIVTAENGARFKKDDAILSDILSILLDEREKAKKKKDVLTSNAIKILMNSFFGVLASPNCRFFSMEVANAITMTGQHLIKHTANYVSGKGYEVIYGDTDSLFIDLREENHDEALKTARKIERDINTHLDEYIKEKYHTENYLVIEFEKLFVVFLMPQTRGGEASKKRYAGLVYEDGKEKIDITGLEFVRRDWTDLAKTFQMHLLNDIFHKKDPREYIRKFVADVKRGKYDDLLVYRKALRKNLKDYTKTTPPHVKAARLLDKVSTSIIEYYMTTNGPEPKERMKHPIDYEHYIQKQLKPIADAILVFYGTNFNDVVQGASQKGLFDF